MQTFRFIDLFSGLGGFHLALARMGGKCVFAAEWKEHLRDLYETNHGLKPAGDITKVNPRDVPSHDVLTAGFPCQPFSKAGEQLGFECTEQGNLFFNVAAILKEKKPSYFILENVPNLLKHDEGTWEGNSEDITLARAVLLQHSCRATIASPVWHSADSRPCIHSGSTLPLDSFVWPVTSSEVTNIDQFDEPDAKQRQHKSRNA